MRIAICNETFVDWPLAAAVERAAELGYQGFEIAPFTLHPDVRQISRKQRLELVQLVTKAGMEIIGLHWLFARTSGLHLTSRDSHVIRATTNYLLRLIDLCFDLGGHILVLGSPQQRRLDDHTTRKDGLKTIADILIEAVPSLKATGIRLGIEPLGPEECNFLRTADEAMELVRLVDAPEIQLHLDVKAMSTESLPIPEIIRRNASACIHFHANDPNRRGPGMGSVDFVPILDALLKSGYTGWLSVEVFDYAPGPETLARESIDYLRRCLAEVSPDPS